jgi:Ca2+-transporting ATPase
MGCATHILSDKTGTLTENDMQVVCGSVAGLSFDTQSTDHGSAFDELTQPLARMVAESASLNSTASLNGDDAIGSRTEAAMLYMSRALGFEPSGVRACSSDIERASPFTSDKRRMSSLYKTVRHLK